MNPFAHDIRQAVAAAAAHLATVPADEAKRSPGPGRWSTAEIVGHLVDSAMNNIQRVVRASYDAARDFPPYEQDPWVAAQCYNEADWAELVELWRLLNLQLCRDIDALPAASMDALCNIGREALVPIGFIIEDYLRHLRHHLAQLPPNAA
jgi:hypothetical protein